MLWWRARSGARWRDRQRRAPARCRRAGRSDRAPAGRRWSAPAPGRGCTAPRREHVHAGAPGRRDARRIRARLRAPKRGRRVKLFVIVSSLDLTQPFSATPAWWQLFKGLYEIGVEVIVAPYQGPAIEAPWWQAVANPARREGDTFKALRDRWRAVGGARPTPEGAAAAPDSTTDRLVRRVAQTAIAPRWRAHVDRVMAAHPDIDAVLIITVPLNHITGLARHITERHGKPVFFYDGDVPASLPNFRGFASGFRIYQGADPSEYTAFLSNSLGGAEGLRALGAREVHALYYGADPDLFSPLDVAQDLDVFFYGHGREYRGAWIDALLRDASHALANARFAVRGTALGDLGRVEQLPYLSFSK